MNQSLPLYNSRIMRIFADYLRISNTDVDVNELFRIAGITAEEVADTAHWFTQQQTDRFYAAVVEKTGDPNIARKEGRFSVTAKGMGLIKQYVAGLLSTEIALLSIKKIYPLLSRAVSMDVKKLGPGKIEIIITPLEGVQEKPYQCENRLGSIEALPMLFTQHYGTVEHIDCLHKGAPACRYIVSWQNPPSLTLKLIRNYTLLGSLMIALGASFLLPTASLSILIIAVLVVNLASGSIFSYHKTKELEKIIHNQHKWAEDQIELANTRYNNSLLAQEIGQATAAIFNVKELMQKLAALMQNRLDFDRGLIMLANGRRTHLLYSAGYGHSEEEIDYLKKTSFRLDHIESKGFFVRAFLDQKHVIISNTQGSDISLSDKSQRLIRDFSVRSLLCVPIIYKTTALGILAVDNVRSNAPLKQSDINLLEGLAAQIAIGIGNSISFKKLQESEEKYRQTLESINEGFYEINLHKQIKFANKALCRLLNCSYAELVTGNLKEFFPLEIGEQLDHLFDTIRGTHEPVHFYQSEVVTPDNKPIPVDLSAAVILDHQDRAVGFRGFLRNATERLQLETEKKKLESQLLQAQKMEAIGTLAGGIAHNFNNWLAGILGNITLIRLDAKNQQKIIRRVDRIENIIDSASKMTKQLLGYARTGSYEAHLINMNDLVKEAATTFAETKKEVSITLALDPDLRHVKADESQIEQVFWNLFINAIDAMPNGGKLHIATKNTTAEVLNGKEFKVSPGNYVSIEFADTGIGIQAEDIKKIFEPFFTTKEGKGTGLGLASSFGIVKAHGGYIDVASQKNRGATFKVLLPVAEQAGETQSRQAPAIEKGRGTILVVDDESMILETSEQLLTRLGYQVLTASSGREALALFQANQDTIHLVMIDMIMPAMSGQELYGRLKELKPSIKTLLCSGYSMNKNAQTIISQGCNGFIQKPFNINHLSATIKQILQPERYRS